MYDNSGVSEEQSYCLVVAEEHLTTRLLETAPEHPNDYIRVEYAERIHKALSEQLYKPSIEMTSEKIGDYVPVGCASKKNKNKTNVCRGSFVYQKLAHLRAGKACVYGAVVSATIPRSVKTKNYWMSLRLVDETSKTPFTVNVFSHKLENLPQVRVAGDIMRFNRLGVQYFDGELNGKCAANQLDHLTIRWGRENKMQIYCPKKNYSFSDSDRDIALALKHYVDGCKLSVIPLGCVARPFTVQDILQGKNGGRYIDMVVKFASISAPKHEQQFGHAVCWNDETTTGAGDGEARDVQVKFYVDWSCLSKRIQDDSWYHLRRVSVSNTTIGFDAGSSLLIVDPKSVRVLQQQGNGTRQPSRPREHEQTGNTGRQTSSEPPRHDVARNMTLVSILTQSDVALRTEPHKSVYFRCKFSIVDIWPEDYRKIAVKQRYVV